MKIKAIYENGVLRPLEKLDLEEKREIEIKISNAVRKTKGIIKVKQKLAKVIAEGDERETDKEAVRYFYIAKGSSAEVLTQATIAFEIGYIPKETFKEIEKGCTEISSMLSKLISARSKTFRP